ncbi:MAG TPA: PEP-CTERM sorting domain-containing protein [Phycisphaerae bacterium]|nr:PEP-CTERM sorting domain-containing protein [Phycisphaerae bacterium]
MQFKTLSLIAAAVLAAASVSRADVVLLSDTLGNATNPSRTAIAGSTTSGGYVYTTSVNVAPTPANGYVTTTTVNPTSTTITESGSSNTNFNTSYTVGFTSLPTAGLLSVSADISCSAGFAYMGFATQSATGTPKVDPTTGNLAGWVNFGPTSQLGANVQLIATSSDDTYDYSGSGYGYLGKIAPINGTTTYHLLLTVDPATRIVQTTLSNLDGSLIWQSPAHPDGLTETLDNSIDISTIKGISFGVYGYSLATSQAPFDSATISNLQVSEAGSALPGDATLDGKVDLTDLSIVLNNFGTAKGAWTDGNFDQAATIDLTDLSDVLNNFGTSASTSVSAGAMVAAPEPASLALLGVGGMMLLRRRSRA